MNPSSFKSPRPSETPSIQDDQTWSGEKVDLEKNISTLVCKALKAAREEQNISQQRLSEIAGISRSGLRHMESLETSPTLFSLLKVAKALNVKISEILISLDH